MCWVDRAEADHADGEDGRAPREERHREQRAAAAEADAGGDEGDAGGEADEDRVEHAAELRHAEVELDLEGRHRRSGSAPARATSPAQAHGAADRRGLAKSTDA